MDNKTRPVEELLKRIQELEEDHVHLKQKMFNLVISRCLQITNFPSLSLFPCEQQQQGSLSLWKCPPPLRSNMCWNMQQHSGREAWYFNIFESIDHPIHILDANGRVIYRNAAWEEFYGYNASETYGKPITELLFETNDVTAASDILNEMLKGGSWSGEFPVKNKKGKRFLIFGSIKPLHDDDGNIMGLLCASALSSLFQQQIIHHLHPAPTINNAEPSILHFPKTYT